MTIREHSFRAKRADGRVWVYGVPVKNFMVYNTCYESKCLVKFSCSEIKRETIGEYTGLADKNGVKIFEGDIISHELFEGACAVVYNVEAAGFELMNVQVYPGNRHPIIPGTRKYMTVIGNIFDNPELMPEDFLKIIGRNEVCG